MNYLNRLSFLFMSCLLFSKLGAAAEVTYEFQHFSPRAHELMEDHGWNALYKVDLSYVKDYLSAKLPIAPLHTHLIAKRVIPGKSYKLLSRYRALDEAVMATSADPKAFFGSFHEGVPHTYVILKDRLIFTESTSIPSQEKYKDKFSKHYFISGFKNHVYCAGEFYVYKNENGQEIFVVFDNKSGTFRPSEDLLPQLKELLSKNFSAPGLHFSTKHREQQIDKNKLFQTIE